MKIFLLLWTIFSCATSQQLPQPTDQFPYTTSLDNNGNYILRWNYNDTHIAFEIIANTLGWVGFGISESGLMVPADVFVAYIKPDLQGVPHVYYGDFHIRGRHQPKLDNQQDWYLGYGYEDQGRTILGVIRKLDTCDSLYDTAITAGDLHLIYAYHPQDPVNLTALEKHPVETRGVKVVQLIEPTPEPTPPALPNDTRAIVFNNINFSVPVSDTSFECLIFNMSHNKVKHHIVKLEPIFDPSTKNVVRSLTLYRCYIPDNRANFETGQYYDCYTDPPPQLKLCQEYVAGFQQGSEAMYLPGDVGIGVGGEDESNIWIMKVQYENDKRLPNLIDNSGIRVYYTDILRPQEGAFFTMGNIIINRKWGLFIPPGMKDFQSTAYCSSRCINWANHNTTSTPMTAVGVVFQTKGLGRKMKLRHTRQRNPHMANENPWLSFADKFDNRKQKLNLLEERTLIQATDSLMLECTYDSSAKKKSTLGGWGKEEELCRAHILYYPRKNIEGCLSWSNFDHLRNEYGRLVDPTHAFEILNSTDWTKNKHMHNNLKIALKDSFQMEQCWSSYRAPSFAYSYFKPPLIPQPYTPRTSSTCP